MRSTTVHDLTTIIVITIGMADQTQAVLPRPTLQTSTAITATDHGQIVVLASLLCVAIGVLLSIARVYIRWPLNVLAGKDDIAYAVAMVTAAVQTAVTVSAVQRGFGKVDSDLSEWQMISTSKVSPTLFPNSSVPAREGSSRNQSQHVTKGNEGLG